jgi:hypothetical protein
MDNEEFEDAKMQRREDSHIKTLIPQRKSIQKLMASSRFDVMELRWTIDINILSLMAITKALFKWTDMQFFNNK